ncbi:MAG: hypothetical protein ABGZ36_13535, partial [Actinomycetota bacterium]
GAYTVTVTDDGATIRGFGASVRLDGNGITMGIGPSSLVLDPSAMTLDAISLDLAAQQSFDLAAGGILHLLGAEVHLGACGGGVGVARVGDAIQSSGQYAQVGSITSASSTVFAC